MMMTALMMTALLAVRHLQASAALAGRAFTRAWLVDFANTGFSLGLTDMHLHLQSCLPKAGHDHCVRLSCLGVHEQSGLCLHMVTYMVVTGRSIAVRAVLGAQIC